MKNILTVIMFTSFVTLERSQGVGLNSLTAVKLQSIQLLTDVEFRGARLQDIVAYLRDLYSRHSPDAYRCEFLLQVQPGGDRRPFESPTQVTLSLSKPSFLELVLAIVKSADVELRFEDHSVIFISRNPLDCSGASAEVSEPAIGLSASFGPVAEGIVDVNAVVRYAAPVDDYSFSMSGSFPLEIEIRLQQVRVNVLTACSNTNMIKHLSLDDDNPLSITFEPIEQWDSETYGLSDGQWIIRKSLSRGKEVLGFISALDPNIWPRIIPRGLYKIGILCRFYAELDAGEKYPFSESRSLRLIVTEPVDSRVHRECFMAWLQTLYYSIRRDVAEARRQKLRESLRMLIGQGFSFEPTSDDERLIGLAALEASLKDLAYHHLSGYISRYLDSPPHSSVADVHDAFYDAFQRFKQLCRDNGYVDPYTEPNILDVIMRNP